MKVLSRELKSAALTLALPLAVVAVFPYGAISFQARPTPAPAPASAGFVSLSASEEIAALKSARSAWQSKSRPVRVRLPLGVLPSADSRRAFANLFPRPLVPFPVAVFGRIPYAPSVAAPASSPSATGTKESELPFSRAELLELKF